MNLISNESKWAQGLVKIIKNPIFLKSKLLEIESINYDYLEMNIESPKVLWIELKHHPSSNFRHLVGKYIRLHIQLGVGIQTQKNPNSTHNSIFKIDDIVGKRIVLLPYKGQTWLPTVHQPNNTDMGWGYNRTYPSHFKPLIHLGFVNMPHFSNNIRSYIEIDDVV